MTYIKTPERRALSKEIGNRLRTLRRERGLSCRAVWLGITENYENSGLISHYENADQCPSILTLVKLAEFFDVSLDYLCGITEKREVNQ